MLSIIETIFALFQMQIKSMLRDTVEFLQPSFRRRPETFYPVNMVVADGKLIARMIDSKVFRVADINQSVITAPAVRVNDALRRDVTANNGFKVFALQFGTISV